MNPESNQYECFWKDLKKKHIFTHLKVFTTNCHHHYRTISLKLFIKKEDERDGESESKGQWEEVDWASINHRKNEGVWDKSRLAAARVITDPVLIFRHSDVYSRIDATITRNKDYNSRLNPHGALPSDQWTSSVSLQRQTLYIYTSTVTEEMW